MAKYLDYAGLQYLWTKIKNYVSTQPLGANVRYDAQTLTSAQQSQARANIAAGGSNRNLLDNPWFTVRQRGAGPFSSAGYTVDRWKIIGGNVVVTPRSPYGVNLNWTTACAYDQYLDIDPQILVGKTVTLSAMVDGVVYSQSAVYSASGAYVITITVGNVLFRLGYFTSTGRVFIRIGNAANNVETDVNVDAIKLELGSVSTLANDAPPNYEEELAKCQRYFVRFAPTAYTALWGGISANTGLAIFNVITPVPMMAAPTVSVTNAFYFVEQLSSGPALRLGTAYTAYAPVGNIVRLGVNTNSTLTTNNICQAYTYAYTPIIDLSADL